MNRARRIAAALVVASLAAGVLATDASAEAGRLLAFQRGNAVGIIDSSGRLYLEDEQCWHGDGRGVAAVGEDRVAFICPDGAQDVLHVFDEEGRLFRQVLPDINHPGRLFINEHFVACVGVGDLFVASWIDSAEQYSDFDYYPNGEGVQMSDTLFGFRTFGDRLIVLDTQRRVVLDAANVQSYGISDAFIHVREASGVNHVYDVRGNRFEQNIDAVQVVLGNGDLVAIEDAFGEFRVYSIDGHAFNLPLDVTRVAVYDSTVSYIQGDALYLVDDQGHELRSLWFVSDYQASDDLIVAIEETSIEGAARATVIDQTGQLLHTEIGVRSYRVLDDAVLFRDAYGESVWHECGIQAVDSSRTVVAFSSEFTVVESLTYLSVFNCDGDLLGDFDRVWY